ncbi:MAG: hypothetical protein LBM74_09140 [Oscillospiraceae bacterium]|jgi:hypothetical protein|nr:hypothetical protein [Oscillospiraceae bacterium]
MTTGIEKINSELNKQNLTFTKSPLVIGGMAMQYYGLRKSGADIDLIICDDDYQTLAAKFPDKRKDIYGDLGVVIEPFEIWRCIALLDYDHFRNPQYLREAESHISSYEKLGGIVWGGHYQD